MITPEKRPKKLHKHNLNDGFQRKNSTTRKNKSISSSSPENGLILNINFGGVDTTSILERQSFTITDFALYVANIHNLLFGMSFVSFMEVFLEIVIHLLKFFG